MPTISAAAIHQVLDYDSEHQPHHQQQHRHDRHSHPSHHTKPSDHHRKPHLPRVINDDDPILEFPPEKWIASMIGNTGLLYRFSDDLVYKSNVTPREVDLMEAAGDLTMKPLSRVIWKGSRRANGTKAVIMEAGKQFRGSRIPEQKRRQVVVEMFRILEKLHGKGIVHGNVKESNFLWSRKDGRLKIIDFGSARFIQESKDSWNSTYVTNAYLAPSRAAYREQQQQGQKLPPPTVFDDYYALAIALWGFYTGKPPGSRQFNQVSIKRSELAEVRDDMIRGWIRKVFRMAGCKFVAPPSDPQPRREDKEGEKQQQQQQQQQDRRQQRHSVRG
ncbi:kinase-like domain-containing protein [Cladorrhinum sp. PSN332]|nr:kinase-like domain-containing protein [Cladorrhinum sp. PSN332]